MTFHSGNTPWNKGLTMKDDTQVLKLSHPHTKETKRLLSLANKGCQPSEETRKKTSEAMKAYWNDPTNKLNRSGKNHPMHGKHWSDEIKQKNSEAQVQRFQDTPHPWLGKHLSLEHRQKISEALVGKFAGDRHPLYGKPAPKGSGRGIGSYCQKGHWVRSSYERTLADFYYNEGVEYEYEPKRFYLGEWKGKPLYYRPDFYLPETDTWVEVKGYTREVDREKWKRFRSYGYYLVIVSGEWISSIQCR